MRCPRCQSETTGDARFCEDCGARLDVACPRCGEPSTPGKKFCRSCGATLTSGSADRFASPESYTPRHLAEKILSSKTALEGERKQVTVLFADLKGSLEALADRDPEEARKLLDPVLECMIEAVHRYEGTVNQVMGDGIMALFGAPLAHENHAVRAAYAALRMHHRIRHIALDRQQLEQGDVQIRVGLNSGEVIVRSIGSDLHMDYSAVGLTTHLAARMEQLARPGTTLLTAETLRLAEGYVSVSPRGLVPIKGLPEPMDVYELGGPGPARYRLQAATVRGLSRFIGRATELNLLRRAQQLAQDGSGQIVALLGEPGVGKSRLVHEFVEGPWFHGWLALEARPVAYRKTPSWQPIVDLFARYCHVDPGDDADTIRTKVADRLRALDPALESVLPALLLLADIPTDDAGWLALDPTQRRRRTLEGVQNILLAESRRQPVALVVEDLHRIDEETQAVLDSLVTRLASRRLLLLVTYRPEYRHSWANQPHYTQLWVDPLQPATTYELLDALLGSHPGLLALKSLLVDRTGGNPLFLEETVRTLVEAHALTGEPGAMRLVKPLQNVRVPNTVQAVLAARIDRLMPEARQLLQCAAAIGNDVPGSVLQKIADMPEETLRAGLRHLQSAALLYEANLFPELEYAFRHALVREVAYGSLSQTTRKALHARIVGVIEELNPARRSEQVERLAHHALHGGLGEKAVTYLRQAGAKAAARSAHREAIGFFEQALEALGTGGQSREARETAIDLVFELRASLAPLGEFARTLEHLRRAAAHAEAIGDRRRLGWVSAYLTQSHYSLGEQEKAIRSATQALALGEALADVPLQVVATLGLGQAHHVLGNYAAAQDYLRRVIAAVDGDWPRERWGMAGLVSVGGRIWLSAALSGVGQFAEAMCRAQEAVQLAAVANHPWSVAGAHMALGHTLLSRGHLAEATPVLEQGIAFCRETDITAWLPMLLGALGAARARAGHPDEGVTLLEEAVARARAFSIASRQAVRLTWLAEGYLLAGRFDDARLTAQEARRLARVHEEKAYEGWALQILAEIEVRSGDGDLAAALSHYRAALSRAETLSIRPLAAHCHFGLGKLHLRTGTGAQVLEHLTIAATMYRDMDMRLWLEQVELEIREPHSGPPAACGRRGM